ncbi:MAG TPA: hypothetical protein VK970_23805, partial [Candidatus Methylacidiphilales bacterium]|nr:hypothetical protein [Candidatus Methylacidiphilales bacterium]
SRGVPANAHSQIRLSPDIIPVLEETSSVFKATSYQKDVRVIGTVHKLEHVDGNVGHVTIKGTVDDEPKTVSLILKGEDHASAVKSYKERLLIQCYGALEKQGRSWKILNPYDVSLLTKDNDDESLW